VIALLVATHLVVPLLLSAVIARWRFPSRLHAALFALVSTSYVLWIGLAGRWDWFGYGLRYLWALALVGAVAVCSSRIRALPWRPAGRRQWLSGAILFAFVLPFASASAFALCGRSRPPAAAAPLVFPLRDGVYYVAHGGATRHVNYHHDYGAQRYAVDLTALRSPGVRAAGLYPGELERYAIFGRPVLSPCAGTVVATADGLPDLPPARLDRERPAGNHVVLRCADALVLLAHLQRGSIGVVPGQVVEGGEPLARVGNSGQTTEPHLHLHAVRAASGDPFRGEAVPMVFDGRFLVRNALVAAGAERAMTYWRW
jgi:hypothetical protein